MHDFGKIVYLDYQKTGSSFVSQFLKAACVHPELRLQKHAWITDDYRMDAVYITSIRHPFMLYSSLYRFGLDGRGGIFKRISRFGHGSIYDSFESFCDFILDPENAEYAHPYYSKKVAEEMGLMSFRHLLLSFQYPLDKIGEALTTGEPLSSLMQQTIVSYTLKNEQLNADLLRLSTESLPEHFKQPEAREFLSKSPRINQSTLLPEAVSLDSVTLRNEIDRREALLLSYYR